MVKKMALAVAGDVMRINAVPYPVNVNDVAFGTTLNLKSNF